MCLCVLALLLEVWHCCIKRFCGLVTPFFAGLCIVYDLYISWLGVLLFSVLFCVVLTVFDAQYYVDVYFACGACVCVCVILTCFARFVPLNPCCFWRINSVGL